jgi:signal transduction histidine kinase
MDDPLNFPQSQNDQIPPDPENIENPVSNLIDKPVLPMNIDYSLTSSEEIRHLEAELRLTLEEIARLQNALAEANMKLMSIKSDPSLSSKPLSNAEALQPYLKDLQQPLNTIKGYLELLLKESVGTLGAFQKRFLERIQKSVQHMEESLHGLSVTKSEEHEDVSRYSKSISIKTLIENSIDQFIGTIRTKQIVLKVNFPQEEVRFFGDTDLLQQVLNIMITNGISALDREGHLSINLQTFLALQPQEICFSLESRAQHTQQIDLIPVLPEQYKNHNLTLQGFGSQLEDIVRAKDLVKQMGGVLEVYSNSVGGSVIKVRLPVESTDKLI